MASKAATAGGSASGSWGVDVRLGGMIRLLAGRDGVDGGARGRVAGGRGTAMGGVAADPAGVVWDRGGGVAVAGAFLTAGGEFVIDLRAAPLFSPSSWTSWGGEEE